MHEFHELQRMLSEVIARGYVEEVPVMATGGIPGPDAWYRDKETGEIYSLSAPEPPSNGNWEKVETDELRRSDHAVQ